MKTVLFLALFVAISGHAFAEYDIVPENAAEWNQREAAQSDTAFTIERAGWENKGE